MSGTSANAPGPSQPQFVAGFVRVMGGPGFPCFMLATLTFTQLLLFALLFTPPAPEGLGAFAESFKVWCFGYDPATGHLEWIYPIMLLVNPLMLDLVLVVVWWVPLREALRGDRRQFVAPLALAFTVSTVLAGALFAFEPVRPQGELPFPAEAIRTTFTAPSFSLTNQDGQPVSLSKLRGRVVVVTAVYASCGFTCPMIMGQSKRVIDSLSPEERADLTFVGITLDAEQDTREVLAAMAKAQQISAPVYNLCTGEPAKVEALLDNFNVARSRNAETGVIDHANLFILIDRQGRIAYRLTIGDQQERWLGTALRLLLRDGRTTGASKT
jgi:protein SCO1/2